MDNIQVNSNNQQYVITVYIDKNKVENFVEAIHEAGKTLQREVMRYERNNNWRFNR